MSEMVTVPVKFLEMPNDLVQKGKSILALQGSMKHLIRVMMKALSAELAKNNIESVKLWEEVKREVAKQGVTLEPDEGFFFDYITDKYYISKVKKTGE